jgi:Na+/proline symporter
LYTLSKGGAYADVDIDGKIVKHLMLADPANPAQTMNVIGDKMFPSIAMNFLPPAISIMFIIALISALFPSADGALTALTSSFCIDILGLKNRNDLDEKAKKRKRLTVHFTFAIVFLLCILVFHIINNNSIVDLILELAGYTYGPLLGLFAFGILTKRQLPESWVITAIALIAPVLCFFISRNAAGWFGGFQIGIELLLVNGLLTYLGLLMISKRGSSTN